MVRLQNSSHVIFSNMAKKGLVFKYAKTIPARNLSIRESKGSRRRSWGVSSENVSSFPSFVSNKESVRGEVK